MKFNCSVTINQPLEKVVKLFKDSNNKKAYQTGFLRQELVSGEEGQKGAISKIYFKSGSQEMELTETIITNQLPHTFIGQYHHRLMDNTMKSTFTKINTLQTRYVTEIEYTEFRGMMPKLMAYFFPDTFRKPPQKWLNNFKKFVEMN